MRFLPGSSDDDGERKGSLKRKGRTSESLPPFLISKSESGTVDDAVWEKFNFFCRMEGKGGKSLRIATILKAGEIGCQEQKSKCAC